MSGNPYYTSDIGGFYGAEQPGAELYLRWLQATVFCSHIRVHGIGEREPWAFGPDAEAIARITGSPVRVACTMTRSR